MDINEPKKDYNAPMHTAEHIINQTMVRMFGTGRSISNHIERKKSKVDYKIERALTEDEIFALENEVNRIIAMNLEIEESFMSREEAGRRVNTDKLPSEAGDVVRIISVGDYDHCPCIGQHVKNTSEIGGVKIISSDFDSERNVLRIRYKRAATE
jgi:Ser-tRNA(Ala) deacylase AlaX